MTLEQQQQIGALGVKHNELAHIDALERDELGDAECLAEIREVITRHGKLSRFGVALLHKHFDLAPDEIMLESCDVKARTLHSRPVKKSSVDSASVIQTIWRFDAEANSSCQPGCPTDAKGNHHGYKDHL